jgi:hypothetical protein
VDARLSFFRSLDFIDLSKHQKKCLKCRKFKPKKIQKTVDSLAAGR